ncbi:MAG: DUF898 family protein [Clostridia bacterium]|nr:DUF898 family protein [Clostridia bacterium]
MAKNNAPVNAESRWDGRLLPLIGIVLLQLLIFGVCAFVGVLLVCWNIVGVGGSWMEDLQNPVTILLVLAGCAVFGLGIAWPCMIYTKWDTKQIVVSNRRFKFVGTTWAFFWHCVLWTILTIITCGIYGLWVPVKVKQWVVKNTVAAPVEEETEETEEETEAEESEETKEEAAPAKNYMAPIIIFNEYEDESELQM